MTPIQYGTFFVQKQPNALYSSVLDLCLSSSFVAVTPLFFIPALLYAWIHLSILLLVWPVNLQQFNLFQDTDIWDNLDEFSIMSMTCAVGILFTYVSMFTVDKLGRKVLLLLSIIVMGLCTFLISSCFIQYANEVSMKDHVTFMPLICVLVYMAAFSIGFGPIPWTMMCEIFPARIKGIYIYIFYISVHLK